MITFDQMAGWLLAPVLFVTAGLISFLLANALLQSRFSSNTLDQPNDRSMHQAPVPRIGGLAVIGTVIAFLIARGLMVPGAIDPVIIVIAVATLILVIVGAIDDRTSLSAITKGIVHLACALGTAPLLVHAATVSGQASVDYWYLWLAIYVAILCWSANLYNFMDGSDGLAGIQAIVGFGMLAILADTTITQIFAPASTLQYLSWSISAAAAGFLALNWAPARMFLGDAGSVPLGYLAGTIGLYGTALHIWPVWVPLAAFSPFLADATLTLARRTIQGHAPWKAHRDHIYQRLILREFSHRKVAILYGIGALLAVTVAGTTSYQNSLVSIGLWTAIMVLAIWLFRKAS